MNDRITPFEGIAGHVMRRTISLYTYLSGLVFTVVFFVIAFIAINLEYQNVAGPVISILTAVVLARFSLNGFAGEWDGSYLSDAGGSIFDAIAVAMRYVALSSIWIIPMFFIDPGEIAGAVPGATTWKFAIVLLLLVLFLASMSPPVFLIVATSAQSFSDVFRPAHWAAVFAGRMGDLYYLYVVYLGSVLMVVVSLIPVAIVIGAMHMGMLTGVAVIFFLPFLIGFTLAFLGRMCGFFVALSMDPDAETFRELAIAGRAGFQSVVRTAIPQTPASTPVTATPNVDSPSRPIEAAGPGTPSPPAQKLVMTTSPDTRIPTSPGTEGVKKPPLMDARERIEGAMTRFSTDPQGAIRLLQELANDYAPSPHVLHALCIALARSGDEEKAIECSREALPLCLERGNIRFAADIYRALLTQAAKLGLTRDQTIAVANSLRETKDLRAAAFTYASVIRVDAGETRAVKGLLQVAQGQLQTGGDPQEALRLFNFLLHHCGDSPLADFMKQGKADAEMKVGS